MVPVSFDEANMVLHKPENMTCDECETINAFYGDLQLASGSKIPGFVTCYKLTKDEVDALLQGQCVWLLTVANVFYPVALTTKHPFKE